MIRDGDLILFQGDSITDAGRDRSVLGPNEPAGLGSGYVMMIAEQLLDKHGHEHVKILNRGVGGDRSVDMAERWRADCIYLRPNVVSILIGVNDTWQTVSDGDGVSPQEFETTYRKMLGKLNRLRPSVQIILCEPFVMSCGEVTTAWFPDIDERRNVVRNLAEECGALFVPFQAKFDEAAKLLSPAALCADGVHPTLYGHELMAETWIKSVATIA